MLSVLNVAYPFASVGRDSVGSAEQMVAELDEALTQAGHRSIVVASEESKVSGLLFGTPKTESELDLLQRQRAWEFHQTAIEAVLRKWHVDVIHMHGADFANYLPILHSVPTLVTQHGALQDLPSQVLLHRDLTLSTIMDGVRVEAFPFRRKKGGYVAVLGRICPETSFHYALDAAWLARVPLLLAGGVSRYPEHERYFRDIIKLRLDPMRRFLRPAGMKLSRRMKVRLLSGARCVLMTSADSRVAMEALACGTPVIAFRTGPLPDIIDDGKTGFIVNDVWEMARAIDAVGSLDPLRCREAAEARFSLDRTVADYFRTYEHLSQGGLFRRVS